MTMIKDDTRIIKFFMALKSDPSGDTGAPDLSPLPAFYIDKDSGMAPGAGVVSQSPTKGGWYYYTPGAADVSPFVEVGMEATATGCFTWRDKDRIVAAGPTATAYTPERAAALDNLDAAVSGVPTADENAAAVAAAAATTPLPAELVKVKGTPLGTHAGTALDPFGP